MADGTPFSLDKTYNVAMTSYRANGGGGLLEEAGVEEDESRIVARLPEIRNILYDYLMANGTLDPYSFGSILGSWQFVPESARKQAAADLKLLFP
jgi:2',3'-cyclic-nucleotide 2'-phosphodiesterase/3'-nucleotidase